MKIERDKEYKRIYKESVYKEELDEIGRFLKSNHQNVCFCYENAILARNAYARLRISINRGNIPVKLMRREADLYVLKKSK